MHADSTGNRVCVIALATLWHQVLWGAVLWLFYYVVPMQMVALRDFDIDILPFIAHTIAVSTLVVIYYQFLPVFLLILIAVDAAVMSLLFKKPVRQMLWFLCMSALPFFAFVYGVMGVVSGYQWMAVQLALEQRVIP